MVQKYHEQNLIHTTPNSLEPSSRVSKGGKTNMAQFNDVTRKAVLVLDGSADSNEGGKKYKVTIRGISETASADQVMQACQAFAKLFKYPLLNVYIDDKNEVLYDAEDAEENA